MSTDDAAERELEGFIVRFTPEVAGVAREARARMRARLPGATQLVYDNYNALVIGFGPDERASDAVFSVALFPRWVSLCFLYGAGLPDPEGRLQGKGNQVRHVVLHSAADLDDPVLQALIDAALERRPIDPSRPGRLVIRSVSAKQRPRRPR
jgi:hypothetical protein